MGVGPEGLGFGFGSSRASPFFLLQRHASIVFLCKGKSRPFLRATFEGKVNGS